MAKEYNVGDRLYLPVWVTEKETNVMMGPDKSTTITDAKFSYAYWHGKTGEGKVRYGEPGLLLTTEEVAEEYKDKAAVRIQLLEKENATYRETISNRVKENEELGDENRELKSRNAELEALLKEVMATRDEAIRQNDELITKNNELEDANCNLTKACSEWQIAAQTCADNAKVADKATEELRKENKDLKAKAAENADAISRLSANKVALTEEVGRLRETIADRTIDVQHIAEENAQLQNKVSEFQNRVGEQLAQIQDLNAEIHYLKEERDLKAKLAQEWHDNAHSTAKGLDELKGRYDELDSVNHEQAEKIRSLDKTVAKLKDENTNLSFLLEAKPEEETKKPVHVFTNDGTEVEFRRYTAVQYRTDYNILVIKDGEEIVAGFIRGDRPGNLAYWWTE